MDPGDYGILYHGIVCNYCIIKVLYGQITQNIDIRIIKLLNQSMNKMIKCVMFNIII